MKKLLTIWILFLGNSALAFLEIYSAAGGGTSVFDEMREGIKYDHRSYFDATYSFGARVRPCLWFLCLGGMAEVGWVGQSVTRGYYDVATSTPGSSGYRVERTRYLAGPAISIRIAGLVGIDGEYYAHYSSNISYSDDKSRNPFRKYERHTGSGWGAGLSFHIEFFVMSIMGREFTMRDYNFDPDNPHREQATYTPMVSREVIFTAGFEI